MAQAVALSFLIFLGIGITLVPAVDRSFPTAHGIAGSQLAALVLLLVSSKPGGAGAPAVGPSARVAKQEKAGPVPGLRKGLAAGLLGLAEALERGAA